MSKILFYDAYYMEFYGAQKYLYELVSGIKKFERLVVTPQQGPLLDALSEIAIDTDVLAYPDVISGYRKQLLGNTLLGKFRAILGLLRYNINTIRFIKAKNIELVYCNNLRSILSVGLAAKISGRPLIWYVQLNQSYGYFDWIGLILADKIVTISNNVQDMFPAKWRAINSHKLMTIYPGLDLNEYDKELAQATKICKPQNTTVVGIVAAISERKGHHLLIEVIHQLIRDSDLENRIELWIIGDSLQGDEAYRQQLETQIASCDLHDVVRILGWRDDVAALLSLLDLFVLPSSAEGVPKSIVEAMSAGCPVIATDVGGISELVEHNVSGIIIPPNDKTALYEALCYLIRFPKLGTEMGMAGRKQVEEKFTRSNFVSNFERLFASLIHAAVPSL